MDYCYLVNHIVLVAIKHLYDKMGLISVNAKLALLIVMKLNQLISTVCNE